MGGYRCSAVMLLLVCIVKLSCCVTVEFFSGADYSNLLEKKTVDPTDENKCTRLDNFHEFQSIKTDRCVMIYETEDCSDFTRIGKRSDNPKATSYSYRFPNNTHRFSKEDSLANYRSRPDGITRGVQSFHVCNQELGGGPKLDVDLFNSALYNTWLLLKSWRGVCKCETLPGPYVYKEREQMSINNHGNNLYIYSKEKCQGTARFIPAGDNDRSRVIYKHTDVIKSFRPADSLNCLE